MPCGTPVVILFQLYFNFLLDMYYGLYILTFIIHQIQTPSPHVVGLQNP